ANNGIAKIATNPVKLVLGKSLVPSGVTDDVFAGVTAEEISYQRPPGYTAPQSTEPSLRIGDPWNFYHNFWRTHGLDRLADIVPLEVTVHTGEVLSIPLIVDNPTGQAIDVTFSADSPSCWQ